ncbi:butyrophilin-like protein [Pontoporia blainvillei]|uniref:Butyrophilin-like protein n=1 Tax=Pontoporia blainvillei TaxID=48723 RepID=A0ABX0RZD5_PONBL|nr:butyrophilin-like protein [Pontoporia blainvillei]
MVLLGADASLPCQLSPEQSAAHMQIWWYRAQLSSTVLAYQNGQEQGGEQMLEYRGRTELVGDSIGKGTVALLIQHIRASDDGQYRCHFKDGHISQEAIVELRVVVNLKAELERRKALYNEDWKKALLYPALVTLNHENFHQNNSDPEREENVREETRVLLCNKQGDCNLIKLGQKEFTSGRHYWEVDIEDTDEWTLGIYEKPTERSGLLSHLQKKKFSVLEKGREYRALTCSPQNIFLEEPLLIEKCLRKIVIFLDYEDSDISFYNMTDRTHIFSFTQANFSGSLYPYFKLKSMELSSSVQY